VYELYYSTAHENLHRYLFIYQVKSLLLGIWPPVTSTGNWTLSAAVSILLDTSA